MAMFRSHANGSCFMRSSNMLKLPKGTWKVEFGWIWSMAGPFIHPNDHFGVKCGFLLCNCFMSPAGAERHRNHSGFQLHWSYGISHGLDLGPKRIPTIWGWRTPVWEIARFAQNQLIWHSGYTRKPATYVQFLGALNLDDQSEWSQLNYVIVYSHHHHHHQHQRYYWL